MFYWLSAILDWPVIMCKARVNFVFHLAYESFPDSAGFSVLMGQLPEVLILERESKISFALLQGWTSLLVLATILKYL